jgi:hypothetical protein
MADDALTVSLTVAIPYTAGLTFTGSETGSSITFSDSRLDLNEALTVLIFMPASIGNVTIEVELSQADTPDSHSIHGHVYEVVPAGDNGIVWSDAQTAAEAFEGASENWQTGQPDDYENLEDCGEFRKTTNAKNWNDQDCALQMNYYIVEYGDDTAIPIFDTAEIPVTVTSEDADGDGMTDSVEGSAPNGGDGNGDGTPDYQQAEVVSRPGHAVQRRTCQLRSIHIRDQLPPNLS